MRDRVRRLKEASRDQQPSVSAERALLITAFYREHAGKHAPPVLRAMAFRHICQNKTVFIGDGELIVGERGPVPKACPTYPELTCHSLDDLRALASREKTRYEIPRDVFTAYEDEVIPYWKGRALRDRLLGSVDEAWERAYRVGVFTEFMEQRAPGHTAADGKPFRWGLADLRARISDRLSTLEGARDPGSVACREQLRAMDIAAEGCIVLAHRHADAALSLAKAEGEPARRNELLHIADVCRRVPKHAPRSFWEALQAYWFHHLSVITELNGWDAFSPGHLDQHLEGFYQEDVAAGRLTREKAKELLACLWIKFNNQPAPPKVGVTAAESGTYNDFVNINLGGLRRDGTDGSGDVSGLILELADELRLLQPQCNLQVSQSTPEPLLREACRVVREGLGYPALFNADLVVDELVRQGKRLEDAREGGTSGCVETGAFGKEAYILSGYFNLVKVLELTLGNGVDPHTGLRCGPATGDPASFDSFEALMGAWKAQLRHMVEVKLRGNALVQALFANDMPAPYLSLLIDDCIDKGIDYNAGGARYNTTYIQGVGIGTLTDSLSALFHHVYVWGTVEMGALVRALRSDFRGSEVLRKRLVHTTPRYGNDDDRADGLMCQAFEAFLSAVDGRPAPRGGTYRINMLPTTSHIYFGTLTGATPDGRHAGQPLSEGISPVQGADEHGPTAVLRSAAKMDHLKTGGTLLNIKFAPDGLAGDEGLKRLAALVRGYFALGGHHMQFNVVDAELLREAQAHPEAHQGLLVRVAGYSDYFCDLGAALQEEIISRTAHGTDELK